MRRQKAASKKNRLRDSVAGDIATMGVSATQLGFKPKHMPQVESAKPDNNHRWVHYVVVEFILHYFEYLSCINLILIFLVVNKYSRQVQ